MKKEEGYLCNQRPPTFAGAPCERWVVAAEGAMNRIQSTYRSRDCAEERKGGGTRSRHKVKDERMGQESERLQCGNQLLKTNT